MRRLVCTFIMLALITTTLLFSSYPTRDAASARSHVGLSPIMDCNLRVRSSVGPGCVLPFGPDATLSLKSNISVLLINVHFGVANEVEGTLKRLGTSFTVTHNRGVPVANYRSTKEASDGWWSLHSSLCDEYDVVICGDTAPLSRPMFEYCTNSVVIGLITNRYDWAISDDKEYDVMMAAASRRPNVRIVENNLFEQYHAKVLKKADIFFSAYIPSAGIPSQLAEDIFDDLSPDDKQRKVDDTEILLVDHTTKGRDHAERDLIISYLRDKDANLRVLRPAQYGGPLGLQNRVLLHIPYQSNTMALFENLGVNVIYLLPSLSLYRTWGNDNMIGHQVRMAGHRPYDLDEEVYGKYIDWYRSDLRHLFYYFDSVDDLLPNSSLRQRIASQAETKRAIIQKYMEGHKKCVITQWKQLFASALPYANNPYNERLPCS